MLSDDYAECWKIKWDYTDRPCHLLENGSGTLIVTGYDAEASTVIAECGHAVDGTLRIPFDTTDTAVCLQPLYPDSFLSTNVLQY